MVCNLQNLEKTFLLSSEPRCIVKPVLACKDAPSRRKYADSPALYRAGPWAQKKAPRDHAAPVTGVLAVLQRNFFTVSNSQPHTPVQRQMKPVTVSVTPAKVASSSSVEWEPVASTPVKHGGQMAKAKLLDCSVFGTSGLKDYGPATLHCKVRSLLFLGFCQVGGQGGTIQGKEGIKFCHLATLPS